jgi:hypothetical protein
LISLAIVGFSRGTLFLGVSYIENYTTRISILLKPIRIPHTGHLHICSIYLIRTVSPFIRTVSPLTD